MTKSMTDNQQMEQVKPEEIQEEPWEEEYGWAFHKMPLLYAAIATGLLYSFVFFYVNR
jgi:hypothetical protein